MANAVLSTAPFFLPLLLLSVAAATATATATLGNFPIGPEKRAHLQFYIHDKISSPNATAVKVAGAPSGGRASISGLNFASVYVIDDPLTEGPDPASKPLGRARGFYAVSSLDGSDLYFTVQVLFTDGVYNGSSVAVMARDPILEPVRELPIIGGTGVFRLARGFAFMKTHKFDTATGDAVLYIDAYILHN